MENMPRLNRRGLLLGLAGASAGVATGGAPSASAQTGTPATPRPRREPLEVRTPDGLTLYGEAQGPVSGPEIVFIHGLRQSRMSWDRQFDDPALAGFRLVAFDLRGHGDSDKPNRLESYSDADLWADDVAAMIQSASLRRPVLVGWSLGGHVAGAYLAKHGGSKVAGINLVDAVTKLAPDLLTESAGRFTARCTSHDLAERTAATAEFLAECFHQQPTGHELQNMLVVNGMTARAVNEGFIRTKATDLEPTFAAYHGPILCTHGVHDKLVRVAMSERIAALSSRNRLSLFHDSGHSPFYEEPARYNRELAAFVINAARG